MYRPLVLPKFGTSRGQPISPGVALLTTGGPKHRGRLLSQNPNLRNFAEGWNVADGVIPDCGTAIVGSESVRLENYTNASSCLLMAQADTGNPYVPGQEYRVRLVLSEYTGDANPTIILGNEGYGGFFTVGRRVYDIIVTKNTDPLGDNRLQLNLSESANVTIQIEFFAVYEINL